MISKDEADAICKKVVRLFVRSRSCRAVLYGGGVESAAERYVAQVLEPWANGQGLALVPQHKADRKVADYAFCDLPEEESYCLKARGVLEVKGNYASQRAEFRGAPGAADGAHRKHLPRLLRAAIQVAEYSEARSDTKRYLPAFVMYVVAEGKGEKPPRTNGVSSGAAHFRPDACLSKAISQLTMQGKSEGYAKFPQAVRLLGRSYEEQALGSSTVVCLLFKVNVAACIRLGSRFLP